jgi:hypothetical protein
MMQSALITGYESWKEKALTNRRLKHKELLPLIKKRNPNLFQVQLMGASYEKREIYLLKAGNGPNKIALWSQMHGNEPTGTQALFDIFNFIENPLGWSDLCQSILSNCSLYFIPMLNPDGAERFQRRNAQDIDINRDALKLITPEGFILNRFIDELKPDVGFNLHDQDIWYSAGASSKPATLSFLTPSFNTEKDLDENRIRSMRLIASVCSELNTVIPGQIARYKDDFMPSAFGDQIQRKGVATILIESGGYKDDPEKQTVRKLNFLALMHAFEVIASGDYKNEDLSRYQTIPFNVKNKLFDYLLRNVELKGTNGSYRTDVGIRSQLLRETDTYLVDDIGDLSGYFGYNETSGLSLDSTIRIGDDAGGLIKRYF